ncbi:DsrE family protein [candidate division KSB1 bacterium]|nr:DsrE family protein [candidate division KSB1 bacterium]
MEKIATKKKKLALFAFNGELMCFVHVLLNGLDLHANGYEIKIILEGAATRQAAELTDATKPFANLYAQAKELGLFDCVCQACANKMGVLDAVKAQQLPLGADLSGHPSMRQYLEKGYEIITF